MTAKLTIEYDGTDFAGWAAQPGVRTVQAELERALGVVLRQPIELTVAGRTDRGVHAWAQIASYEGDPVQLTNVNALLPEDVAVTASAEAPAGFDARRHCTSRAYCFRVLTRRTRPVLTRGRVVHWLSHIDLDVLQECAAMTVGIHDFTAFTPADTYHVRFRREIYSCYWVQRERDQLEFWIEGESFLRHMNRILVGTMLDVCRGRLSVDDYARLLEGRSRVEAGVTAQARGLYFVGAGYQNQRVLRPAGGESAIDRLNAAAT